MVKETWSNSSLQVIDPKASAAPPWSVVMSATAARWTSDLLDGQGMLTAELTVVLAARLSTAVYKVIFRRRRAI